MVRQISVRLKSGQDLREEIEKVVKRNGVKAGVLVSIVGGLSRAVLRMAGGEIVKTWDESLEIVAGTGTVSENGCHIHIAVSTVEGTTIGGHLKNGCIVIYTVEIVLLVFDDAAYRRQYDAETGYDELAIT